MSREDRKRQLHRRIVITGVLLAALLIVLFFLLFGGRRPAREGTADDEISQEAKDAWRQYDIGSPVRQVECPDLDVQLLSINDYSRPGIATDGVTGIVIHYTANPGSTAQENRDYFENLKDTQETKVSSNFVIGIEGEIIQCIPTDEIAYASNSRNSDTVSVECCHVDETGSFTEATYTSLMQLVAFLCGKFNLTMDAVIRHYDVTEKLCPLYFVEHEDAWYAFLADVARYIEENGT